MKALKKNLYERRYLFLKDNPSIEAQQRYVCIKPLQIQDIAVMLLPTQSISFVYSSYAF